MKGEGKVAGKTMTCLQEWGRNDPHTGKIGWAFSQGRGNVSECCRFWFQGRKVEMNINIDPVSETITGAVVPDEHASIPLIGIDIGKD